MLRPAQGLGNAAHVAAALSFVPAPFKKLTVHPSNAQTMGRISRLRRRRW